MSNTCTDKLCATATVHFLRAKWFVHAYHYKGFICSNYKASGEHKQTIAKVVCYNVVLHLLYTLWLSTCIIQVPHVITWLAIYITLSLSIKVQTIIHDTQKTFSFVVAAVIIIKFITFIYHSSEYIIIWTLFVIMVQFMLVCMHITVLTLLFR